MRLEDLYTPYHSLPLPQRRLFVEQMIDQRTRECIEISQSRKHPTKVPKESKSSKAVTLSAEEQQLCKLLGLSKAQLIALRKAQ